MLSARKQKSEDTKTLPNYMNLKKKLPKNKCFPDLKSSNRQFNKTKPIIRTVQIDILTPKQPPEIFQMAIPHIKMLFEKFFAVFRQELYQMKLLFPIFAFFRFSVNIHFLCGGGLEHLKHLLQCFGRKPEPERSGHILEIIYREHIGKHIFKRA